MVETSLEHSLQVIPTINFLKQILEVYLTVIGLRSEIGHVVLEPICFFSSLFLVR